MPENLTPAMASLSVGGIFRFARLYAITGGFSNSPLYLTDHNTSLDYEGNTYTPVAGMSVTATESNEGVSPSNFQARGILASSSILDADLAAGRFQGALIIENVVDARFPWAGTYSTQRFRVGAVEWNEQTGVWESEVSTLADFFQGSIGHVYTRKCRWRFGDSRCGINLASYASGGEVTNISSLPTFLNTLTPSEEAGYFDDGVLTWLTATNSGNVGTFQVVKTHLAAGGSILLQTQPPYAISVGDTFSVTPGCNKLLGINADGTIDLDGHCIHRFANGANHGGFFALPTNDKVFSTPTAEEVSE